MKEVRKAEADQFTQLIWKGSNDVSLGIKGKWVVAWFCAKGNSPATQEAYVNNVSDKCVVDGYNRCYNELALKYHNQKRVNHEGTKLLSLDVDIAKTLQKLMDKKGFDGTIKETDMGSYANCGQNVFE